MTTLSVTAEIRKDRKLTLSLPPEVPLGKANVQVTIEPVTPDPGEKRPRSSLAQWSDDNAEHWGEQLDSRNVEGFTGRSF